MRRRGTPSSRRRLRASALRATIALAALAALAACDRATGPERGRLELGLPETVRIQAVPLLSIADAPRLPGGARLQCLQPQAPLRRSFHSRLTSGHRLAMQLHDAAGGDTIRSVALQLELDRDWRLVYYYEVRDEHVGFPRIRGAHRVTREVDFSRDRGSVFRLTSGADINSVRLVRATGSASEVFNAPNLDPTPRIIELFSQVSYCSGVTTPEMRYSPSLTGMETRPRGTRELATVHRVVRWPIEAPAACEKRDRADDGSRTYLVRTRAPGLEQSMIALTLDREDRVRAYSEMVQRFLGPVPTMLSGVSLDLETNMGSVITQDGYGRPSRHVVAWPEAIWKAHWLGDVQAMASYAAATCGREVRVQPPRHWPRIARDLGVPVAKLPWEGEPPSFDWPPAGGGSSRP